MVTFIKLSMLRLAGHVGVVGGSWDRFPLVSLEIFLVATDRTMCPGFDSVSKNMYQDTPGDKNGRCLRLMTYHLYSAERHEIPGT